MNFGRSSNLIIISRLMLFPKFQVIQNGSMPISSWQLIRSIHSIHCFPCSFRELMSHSFNNASITLYWSYAFLSASYFCNFSSDGTRIASLDLISSNVSRRLSPSTIISWAIIVPTVIRPPLALSGFGIADVTSDAGKVVQLLYVCDVAMDTFRGQCPLIRLKLRGHTKHNLAFCKILPVH